MTIRSMNKPLSIDSKLPNVGTTIFTEMSLLAQTHGAINLSQGFPDFNPPQGLIDRLSYHLNQQHNQYAPMSGLPALRQQLAIKVERWYQRQVDYDEEITVVPGATAALFCAIQAVVNPGDEVIVFDPSLRQLRPGDSPWPGDGLHSPAAQAPDYSGLTGTAEDTIGPRPA